MGKREFPQLESLYFKKESCETNIRDWEIVFDGVFLEALEFSDFQLILIPDPSGNDSPPRRGELKIIPVLPK